MSLKNATSSILSRLRLASLAGITFGGKRSLYDVFGYEKTLTPERLISKYERQDLAIRIVDMPPEEMWSKPPKLNFTGSDKWERFVSHTSLWDRIIQADKLCSFGPFSVLWIGLPGVQERATGPVRGLEDILYIHAYGAADVEVKAYENNTSSPRFGQPTLYDVRVGPREKQSTVRVHHTRIVHIVDRPLQGLIDAEPRLAQVYNVLDDLLKVGGGAAETFWLTANRGMQVDVDKDMELKEEDATALSEELDEFQHQLRRFVRTRGVKMNVLGADVADPRGVFETLISMLAGATSIPQRILLGSEAGQLASEQDRANWSQYIERRRKVFAEPYVLKPILQKLVALRYLEQSEIDSVEYEWPEAFSTNPLEEALIRASDGRAVVNFSRRNQFGNPLMTDEECRRRMRLPDVPPAGETLPEAPEDESSTGSGNGEGEGSTGGGESGGNRATASDFEQDEESPTTSTRSEKSVVERLKEE